MQYNGLVDIVDKQINEQQQRKANRCEDAQCYSY